MKTAFAFVVVLVLATLLYGQTPATVIPAPAPTNTSGRYQLTTSSSSSGNVEVWLLDTQTGDVWHRMNSAKWTYIGNPTQDPGTKLPTPTTRRAPATGPATTQYLPER